MTQCTNGNTSMHNLQSELAWDMDSPLDLESLARYVKGLRLPRQATAPAPADPAPGGARRL